MATDITPTAIKDAEAALAKAKKDLSDKQHAANSDPQFVKYNKWLGAIPKKKRDDEAYVKKKGKEWPPPTAGATYEGLKAQIPALEQAVKDKTADLRTARQNNKVCDKTLEKFAAGSPGTWKWHKNKGNIMYFTQEVTYDGGSYIALAHIHGKYPGDTWTYDKTLGGGDKIEIFEKADLRKHEGICGKKELSKDLGKDKDTLQKQIGAAEFTTDDRNKKTNMPKNVGSPPAKNEYYNIYDKLDENSLHSQSGYYLGNDGYGGQMYQSNEMNMEVVAISLIVVMLGVVLCAIISAVLGCLGGVFYSKYQNEKKRFISSNVINNNEESV